MSVRLFALIFALWILSTTPAYGIFRDIVFPVNGTSSFRDDFLEPRAGGIREHLGIDIIASKMTPVLSAVDGVVRNVVLPEASWGYSISLSDEEGYQYRYLHLNNDTPGTDDGNGGEENAYASGIKRGVNVIKGQIIGWVGDSGNAEGTVSHLHFEIRDPNRAPVNPYESLISAAAKSIGISINSDSATITPEHQSEGDQGLEEGTVYLFTKNLSLGDRGEAVRELQIRLKTLGYFTSSITDYFGSITRDAVILYQTANKIDPIGVVGPITRAMLNQNVASAPSPDSAYVFTKNLFKGSRGAEVSALQAKLGELGYFEYPTVTGYFGSVTYNAVVSFQSARGIDPIGIVGPKTRAALNSA